MKSGKSIKQEKDEGLEKYLIRWKGFMAEGDTWERKENLKCRKID